MNILYLTTHLNVGGITSYLFTLARGLQSRGHRVIIASSGGACVRRFEAEGLRCVGIPIRTKSEVDPRILASGCKLQKVIRENQIQLFHANTRVTQVLACFLRKVTGLPYIVTCHGFFKVRFTRRVFPCWGVKTIAVSQEVRQHLVHDFGLQPRCVWAIPNGIDSSRFEPPSAQDKARARARFGLGPGPVIGIIARLSSVKGHIYLIQAMKSVLVRHPAAQLFIVGEGREEARLRQVSRESGLKAHVLFVLEVAQTSQALAAMDLFVMPSLQEGLGLSLMEAMACGLAVIGSNVGGIKSLILDGQHGILIPPKDPVILAGAIDALLSDPARAHLLGQRARQFIRANFSESTMIVQTERLYAECVKKTGI